MKSPCQSTCAISLGPSCGTVGRTTGSTKTPLISNFGGPGGNPRSLHGTPRGRSFTPGGPRRSFTPGGLELGPNAARGPSSSSCTLAPWYPAPRARKRNSTRDSNLESLELTSTARYRGVGGWSYLGRDIPEYAHPPHTSKIELKPGQSFPIPFLDFIGKCNKVCFYRICPPCRPREHERRL